MAVATFARHTPKATMLKRRHAWRIGEGLFRVFGRQGDRYTVRVVAGQPVCECVAATGDHGRFTPRRCWHVDLVSARLTREATKRPAAQVAAVPADPFEGL